MGEKPCLDNGSILHQKEFRLLKDLNMGSPEGPQAIYCKLGWWYKLANKFELKKKKNSTGRSVHANTSILHQQHTFYQMY